MENLEVISSLLGERVLKLESVSGGDIAQAYKLSLKGGTCFLKLLKGSQAKAMLTAERNGLELLGQSGHVRVPEVIDIVSSSNVSLLLLEYLPPSRPGDDHWYRLGFSLAKLHLEPAEAFGHSEQNFIGSLSQKNTPSGDWNTFYSNCRLKPQIDLATASGLMDDGMEGDLLQLLALSNDLMPENLEPSLLHGDLWNGNVHFSNGDFYLIDPAVYYGHSEVDLAMSRLFGGFPPAFYRGYEDANPTDAGSERRLPLYQLYYLLVHVNLFGTSYLPSVREVLRKYL